MPARPKMWWRSPIRLMKTWENHAEQQCVATAIFKLCCSYYPSICCCCYCLDFFMTAHTLTWRYTPKETLRQSLMSQNCIGTFLNVDGSLSYNAWRQPWTILWSVWCHLLGSNFKPSPLLPMEPMAPMPLLLLTIRYFLLLISESFLQLAMVYNLQLALTWFLLRAWM